MTTSSKILLINLAVFTAYAAYCKSTQALFFMALWIVAQFVVNLILGFSRRDGKGAHLLSAFLVLLIGFGVCVYDLRI
jgi:uncharacterized membrane protein HdeD (DUF308 family)